MTSTALCKKCGKSFERTTGNQKYCSDNCRINDYTTKKKVLSVRNCSECGSEFLSKRSNQKYCSEKCRVEAYEKRKKKPSKKKCAECGTEFIVVPNNATQKYCSEKCRVEAYEKQRKKPSKKKCAECGTEFLWIPTRPSQKYCSDECRSKHYKRLRQLQREEEEDALKERIKEKVISIIEKANKIVPNTLNGKVINFWNVGGFTEKIKEEIKERDEYTCQVCGSKEGRLEVHHILKRSFGGGHTPDNLITLCTSCHRAIETGDKDHAIIKCYQNALKSRNKEKDNCKLTEKQKINSMIYVLEKTFEEVSKNNSTGELTEILIMIANVLDDVQVSA